MIATVPSVNTKWLAQGMPERCRLPEDEAGWIDLLRSLPQGYDPFTTLADGDYFDAKKALTAISFFHDRLRHVKASAYVPAGTPFWLEPWQQAVVANLFGWMRADGTRRYREALLFIARKNGKSSWTAGLCLYALYADGERGAEVYSAASDRDQASLVFSHAKGMVAQSVPLRRSLQVYKAQRSIAYEDMASGYQVIDSIPEGAHGFNVHFAAIDELHAHKNRELVDVLLTGTGSRAQPLVVHLTTSDYEREGSVCNQKHDYAMKVCRGDVDDPAFLPVVYQAEKDDDWTDPEVWKKANPNLGISITLEYLERECRRAKDDPSYENTFKRLHLNIRTQQDVRAIPAEVWDRGAPRHDEPQDPMKWREWMLDRAKGRRLFGGLDLAASSDLTCYVLIFRDDDGSFPVLPFVWCPKDTALRREKSAARTLGAMYQTWAAQGWMKLTGGDETDYDGIRFDINALSVGGLDPETIAADRLFQGAQLCQQLKEGDGFDVVAFGQGFTSMTAPTKRFLELVGAGKIRHGNNPIAKWMAGNLAVRLDPAGNIKPDRERSLEKIDIMVGIIQGLAMLEAGPVKKASVYETRGLIRL